MGDGEVQLREEARAARPVDERVDVRRRPPRVTCATALSPLRSWQRRCVPSGFRRNDRGGVRRAPRHAPSPVEQEARPPGRPACGARRARPATTADQRFIGRERGNGCVPVSTRSSDAGARSGGRPGCGSVSTSAYSPASAAKSGGGSPSSKGGVNAGPSAASRAGVVPESARPASVSSAQAAVAPEASAATTVRRPARGARGTSAPRRGRRCRRGCGPRPGKGASPGRPARRACGPGGRDGPICSRARRRGRPHPSRRRKLRSCARSQSLPHEPRMISTSQSASNSSKAVSSSRAPSSSRAVAAPLVARHRAVRQVLRMHMSVRLGAGRRAAPRAPPGATYAYTNRQVLRMHRLVRSDSVRRTHSENSSPSRRNSPQSSRYY